MKFIVLLFLSCCLAFPAFSQNSLPEDYSPFAMKEVKTNYFVHESEVSVIEWLEFVYTKKYLSVRFDEEKKRERQKDVLFNYYDSRMLPDKEAIKHLPYSYIFQEYGSHEDYEPITALSAFTELPIPAHAKHHGGDQDVVNLHLNMPIAGVSYEQVNEFCEWKTEIENFKAFGLKPSQKEEYKIFFRLPTPEEFDKFNSAVDSVYKKKKDKHCSLYNYKGSHNCEVKHKKSWNPFIHDDIYSIMSFYPNELGLFDVRGNLAEMTTQKGICKGGSFKSGPMDCIAGKHEIYTGPAEWLGFRCVASTSKDL